MSVQDAVPRSGPRDPQPIARKSRHACGHLNGKDRTGRRLALTIRSSSGLASVDAVAADRAAIRSRAPRTAPGPRCSPRPRRASADADERAGDRIEADRLQPGPTREDNQVVGHRPRDPCASQQRCPGQPGASALQRRHGYPRRPVLFERRADREEQRASVTRQRGPRMPHLAVLLMRRGQRLRASAILRNLPQARLSASFRK